MPSSLQSDQIQPRVLYNYTTLLQIRPDWGGAFILSLGLGPHGATLSTAAGIAGAVSLAIESNPASLREVARTGGCDFVVNTLDEALRAIKNEIRKQTPLSVTLSADPLLTLDAVLERGLAPQLFTSFLPPNQRILDAATALRSLNAALVDFNENAQPPIGFRSSQSLLQPLLERNEWQLQNFIFNSLSVQREFDARALTLFPAGDTLRRRWLEAGPRLLQRQRPPQRSLWLTKTESSSLSKEFGPYAVN